MFEADDQEGCREAAVEAERPTQMTSNNESGSILSDWGSLNIVVWEKSNNLKRIVGRWLATTA